MKCVVTGGAGFIGSHIVDRLLLDGHSVTVIDDLSTGRAANLEHVNKDIEFINASILDSDATARAFRGADIVFHEAAVASVPRSVADPERSHAANATGTLNVLQIARKAGVRRVVYAASSSAYGNTVELPKHEGMVSKPLSPYAAAKLTGESYMRAFHASYGLETISLRYFNIFGPRQDPASEYAAVVPRFITYALANKSPTIFGDGEQTRDFTYIENAVHANMLASTAGREAFGETMNVGAGDRTSVNDLWLRIRSLTGANVDAEHLSQRAGDVRDSLASLDLARKLIGYEPIVPLDEGLAKTVAYFAGRGRLD